MSYVFLDGDDVGLKLEALLRAEHTQQATLLSQALREAVTILENLLSSHGGARLLVFGGDDFLFQCDVDADPVQIAAEARAIFTATTGLTMSGGIGNTVNEALDNLKAAKDSGKDCVRISSE